MDMKYDPFQQQAIDYINEGYSVLVSAPTGAGKTAIAEHIITECLKKNEKVIYTAPIKALSNQKYREFHALAAEKVGILTGDVTLNPGCAVQIMTTEIFRNKILQDEASLKQYSWIIFDEIHYLDDYERGSVWEESLIFFPDHMKLLGLSATVPNVDEMARWLETIHGRPIKVVKEDKRPVPLHVYYQCQNELYDNFKEMVKRGYRSQDGRKFRDGRMPRFARVNSNRPATLIKYLADEELLPCIFFVFSRRRTEFLAEEMQTFDFLNKDEKREILETYHELCERYDLKKEKSTYELLPLIERGIAYHHAGMLPTLKEVVEQLFTRRMLKVIFTTETFALGINMPARSVIFDELRKFYGNGFSALKTRDFYQMAGRAGRRSIDTEGHVFCRVNPQFIAPDEVSRVINGKPEKVNSQFNAAYATLLNLYSHYQDDLYDVYPKSFHHFQVRPFLRKRAVDLLKTKVGVLKELGHIKDQKLTEKGMFASKVYGYELLLAELFEQGVLEHLSVEDLAILAVAIVYEPRKGSIKPPLSDRAENLESLTRKIKRSIHKVEKRARMKDLCKRCYYHLAPAMEEWIKNKSFDDILKSTDADEGEIVRFFRMSIQILREISETPVSQVLKGKIHKAIDLMNRDVVDSEKQLRS